MIASRSFGAALLAAACAYLGLSSAANAEPLVPPTPAEVQYLDEARRLLSIAKDNEAFKDDGELLTRGRLACAYREQSDVVGATGTFISPVLTQLAFISLCPQ